MLRNLDTSATGLDSLQFRMDVIANNIANDSTVGFKRATADFSDVYYQATTLSSASRPVGVEEGLGTKIQGTETQFAQGAFQRTDLPSDVAIQGDGFFPISSTSTGTPALYTRAGNFTVDQDGYLRTASGNFVNGVGSFSTTAPTTDFSSSTSELSSLSAIQIPQKISSAELVKSYSFGNDGAITVTGANGTARTVGYLALGVFRSNTGLKNEADTNFSATDASGPVSYYQPGNNKAGTTQAGALETSNVQLAQEFSDMIITQRNFDANARGVTIGNEMLVTAVNLKR